MKLKVLIAEDHTILRAGLRAMLASDPELEVVGEADNGRDAIRAVGQLAPHLVLMDLNMPGTNGMTAITEIRKRYPDTRVLVLTAHKTEEYIREALEAGANGYVLKDATSAELMMGVKSVLSGKSYLSPGISEKVINGFLDGARGGREKSQWDSLTEREREILKLIAEGHTSRDIAGYLCLSIKTVEKHRSNLMKKLDLHNVSSLTSFAIARGLVTT